MRSKSSPTSRAQRLSNLVNRHPLSSYTLASRLIVVERHVSGTKLNRPELMRLLATAQKGEVLLVESVDRLSRLSQVDWETLKATIKDKGLRLVIADLPTSHMMVEDKGITGQIMEVINNMLLDLMASRHVRISACRLKMWLSSLSVALPLSIGSSVR